MSYQTRGVCQTASERIFEEGDIMKFGEVAMGKVPHDTEKRG